MAEDIVSRNLNLSRFERCNRVLIDSVVYDRVLMGSVFDRVVVGVFVAASRDGSAMES